jgi:drug/metabolite transporter (DMT)-like permease
MKKNDLIIANSTTFLLAMGPLLAKVITMSAEVIILGRLLVATFVLFIFMQIKRDRIEIPNKKQGLMLIVASLFMTIHWVSFFMSIQVSSVAIGMITLHTYPFFTALGESLFKKNSVKPIQIVFGVMIIFAVYLLSLDQIAGSGLSVKKGIAWGILSAIMLAVRNIIISPISQTVKAPVILFFNAGIGSLCLLPFLPVLAMASTKNLLLVTLSGIVFTAFTQTLIVKTISILGATSAGIIFSFQIVYSAVFAWWILSEPITYAVIAGGSIMLLIVFLENYFVLNRNNKFEKELT